jgi:tRNA modification GTPase
MNDTIVAIVTPLVPSAVGIVRFSGPHVLNVITLLLKRTLIPRMATLVTVYDGDQPIDRGIALYFQQPASFTGEDVLELQLHGSLPILERLLDLARQLGCTLAAPGAFSRRAFVHGKYTLTQVEAIAELIHSDSQQAAQAALHTLNGHLHQRCSAWCDALCQLRAQLEAAIDFSDDVQHMPDMSAMLTSWVNELAALVDHGQNITVKQYSTTFALIGPPNAGKSSLLNALTNTQAAIVTDTPGTTRDVIVQTLNVCGHTIRLLDTAGLHVTHDPIETIGIARALQAANDADWVGLLWRADCPPDKDFIKNYHLPKVQWLWTQVDRCAPPSLPDDAWCVSVYQNHTLMRLQQHWQQWLTQHTPLPIYGMNQRHLQGLQHALHHLKEAMPWVHFPEVVAVHLEHAHVALSQVLGIALDDAVLDAIFSNFCIGK